MKRNLNPSKLVFCLMFLILFLSNSLIGEEYKGPAGVSWDQPMNEVNDILSRRFKFVKRVGLDHGVSDTYYYSGEYAAFYNTLIEVTAFKNKLISFAVQIPQQGQFSFSRTWKDCVEKMQKKYGAPKKLNEPPKGVLGDMKKNYPNTANKEKIVALFEVMGQMADKGEMLDENIRAGSWKPLAEWEFDNDVKVIVSVLLGKPNKYNIQPITVVWMFFKSDMMDEWEREIQKVKKEKNIAPDF